MRTAGPRVSITWLTRCACWSILPACLSQTVDTLRNFCVDYRDGSWWSNLLGGNKAVPIEYAQAPRQINPTVGLREVSLSPVLDCLYLLCISLMSASIYAPMASVHLCSCQSLLLNGSQTRVRSSSGEQQSLLAAQDFQRPVSWRHPELRRMLPEQVRCLRTEFISARCAAQHALVRQEGGRCRQDSQLCGHRHQRRWQRQRNRSR